MTAVVTCPHTVPLCPRSRLRPIWKILSYTPAILALVVAMGEIKISSFSKPIRLSVRGHGYGVPPAVEIRVIGMMFNGVNTDFKGGRYRFSTPHPSPL